MTRTAFRKPSECASRMGYEIKFNHNFFKHQPSRLLAVIDTELEAVEKRIMEMMREVTK